MKKSFIFTFIMAILAAIIGAGFASGKEIVSFFGRFGYWAIPFLVLVALLFFFCFYVFSWLGKMIKPKSISDMTSKMFGKAGIFVDFAFILSTFITLSSMLAGSDSIGTLVFKTGYNFCYISIATAMLVAVIVFVGLKYIYKITDIILPIMLISIMAILMVFLTTNGAEKVSSDQIDFNIFSIIIYSVLYVSMNTFYNIFIISKSSQYMNKKQIGKASAISSVMVFVLIALILFAILRGGNSIFLSDMPMVSIAFSINNFAGIVYSIILWLAIFTTICISAYTIVEWLNGYIKNKFLCSVIVLTLGFIFSRFGFSTIVDVFYPIEGIFGTFFIVYSIVYYFKNIKSYKTKQLALVNDLKLAQSKAFDDFDNSNQKLVEMQNSDIYEVKKSNLGIIDINGLQSNDNNNKDKINLSKINKQKSRSNNIKNADRTKNVKAKSITINLNDICSIKVENKKDEKIVTKKTKNGKTITIKKQKDKNKNILN